jgi:WD40 repeat protein
LLSFDRDPFTRTPTVEIAHEALLREWGRLRGWIEASRADIRMQRVLARNAADWEQSNREASYLLHGRRLDQYAVWMESTDLVLTLNERTFLEASLAERDTRRAAETARQARETALEKRARHFLRALVVVLLLATLGSLWLARTARVQANLATSRELAVIAINNLEVDPERSILLSLQALRTAYTRQAEDALHRAVPASRVRMALNGFADGATSIEYSPDGTTIATASYADETDVWEAGSGQKLFSLPGRVARYSPDGSLLVAGTQDGTVTIWDLATREKIHTLRGHSNWIDYVQFSPDGRMLVSQSLDDTFIVWDTERGEKLFTSSAKTGGFEVLYSVAFSPDGRLLVSQDVYSTDKVDWKVWGVDQDWALLNQFSGNPFFVFSPDGRWLAAPGGRGLTDIILWDLLKMSEADRAILNLPAVKPIRTPAAHDAVIDGFAFSPDGTLLATAGLDGTAKVWQISQDELSLLMTLSGHNSEVVDVAFSPDGTRLATASNDGSVRIWDITPNGASEWFTLATHGDRIRRFGLSADGKYLATASQDMAKVWDLASGRELVAIRDPGGPLFGVDISPDGSRLVTGGTDNMARIWKLNLTPGAASAELVRTLAGHAEGPPVGGIFYGLTTVVFSPDGTKLATGGVDKFAKVWDVETGQELLSVLVDTDGSGVTRLAFSPDSRSLATASDSIPSGSSPAIIWDIASGRQVSTFTGHNPTGRIWGMAFSPDGKRVATGGEGGVLKVWDASTGEELLNLSGHTSAVNGVGFSPDGKYLVSAGPDGSARVWDAASGEELQAYTSPGGPFLDARFTPDGKHVIISGAGFVYGYILDTQDLIRLANSRLTRGFTQDECRQYLHTDTCPAEP